MRNPLPKFLFLKRCYHRSSPLLVSRQRFPQHARRIRPAPNLTSLPWKWTTLEDPYLSPEHRDDVGGVRVADVLQRVQGGLQLHPGSRQGSSSGAPSEGNEQDRDEIQSLALLLEHSGLVDRSRGSSPSEHATQLVHAIWKSTNQAGLIIGSYKTMTSSIPQIPELELLADIDVMLWLKANRAAEGVFYTLGDGHVDLRVLTQSVCDLSRALTIAAPATRTYLPQASPVILPSVYFHSTSILLRLLAPVAPAFAEECWHTMHRLTRLPDPLQSYSDPMTRALGLVRFDKRYGGPPLSIMAHPFPQADEKALEQLAARKMKATKTPDRKDFFEDEVPLPDILLTDKNAENQLKEWLGQELLKKGRATGRASSDLSTVDSRPFVSSAVVQAFRTGFLRIRFEMEPSGDRRGNPKI
ncbi:hypothetical protein P152DRAFT_459910 [Eremomyces bilateralis CBS 781.70]|uniref:Methionyl/Valyl/Leucyl/Isoleucyl-tRNA synthetase anticodon-binding domain-containing protein n=1 Tax=Eremomyces bilateralis CBS 781.70 TaxID=1392243 RepID=A0A6G1FZ33_9PEZI|nr:uncharacterized protein P152DRAFT_459910 [Eremomyces bilateralis CBS 781.70]KAF1811038.1 hypothetical protein P152DRAFT_459910 [Eremomyces bilateralis CBS 781.70]